MLINIYLLNGLNVRTANTQNKYINLYLVNGFGRAYVNTVINNKKKTNL